MNEIVMLSLTGTGTNLDTLLADFDTQLTVFIASNSNAVSTLDGVGTVTRTMAGYTCTRTYKVVVSTLPVPVLPPV
jgi:hypothetical protein